MTRVLLALLTLTVSLAVASVQSAGEKPGEWRHYSADNAATKYSPLDQIDRNNVSRLRVAWRRPQIDAALAAEHPRLQLSNRFVVTPIMVDGVLYFPNGIGLVEAVDPGTGRTLWVQQPPGGPAGLGGGSGYRGVAYWSSGSDRRIFSTRNQQLFALDARTGAPVPGFGDGGAVDLTVGLTRPRGFRWTGVPLVVGNIVVIGSSMLEQDSARDREGTPGDVRAYDANSGALLWTFHVIPRAGETGVDTWEDDSWTYSGAGNVWAMMSADEELGYVYLPTSSATHDMYGGHRPGDNLFTSSIVCLDVKTGKRIWHYQTVHHDLFDDDNPAAPILADITVDGKRIKALAQVTKQGFVYVLDRVTGMPVWPIEERPVPPSTVPGEKASPTQPFPSKPAPFDRQGVQLDDLIDFTPELRAEALEIVRDYVIGPVYTPPSVRGEGPGARKGTIQLPGSNGGANWTGAAFDPETGMLYVPSKTNPFVADLVPADPSSNLRYRAGSRALIQGPRGLPLVKPPYGRVTAIDLNRGEHAWMVANGDGPRFHPELRALNLPPLGQAVRSGTIVTRTLLFTTEGDQIHPRTPPGGGGRMFRALDKATGKTLWETAFEAGSTGSPMTYLHDGKQYVVLTIGGTQHPAEMIALSLP